MKKLNEYGLTPQQEIFVNEYIKTCNGYKSYLVAYPKAEKWTRNSVDVCVNKLLNNNKINLRLKAHNEAMEKSTHESITLNKRKILNEIIELQETAKTEKGQAMINLQALKLLAQISKLLDNSPTINNNIQVNTQNINQISNFLDL